MSCTNWKPNPPESVPRHAVQVIVCDTFGRFLVMHRSNTVRSAKNVWSFPSGLHDIGETIEATARRELEEEYVLAPHAFCDLGIYENIAGDGSWTENPQYHWVITMLGALVHDVSLAINKEPDKHDDMQFLPISELQSPSFFVKYRMHESIMAWATPARRNEILNSLCDLITDNTGK